MDNEENKKEEVPVTEVKVEADTPAKKDACRCSGDARTFFISLLTAIIVVLAYHGIVSLVRCVMQDECEKRPQCVMIRQYESMEMPREMKHRRHHHGKPDGEYTKEFRRLRRHRGQPDKPAAQEQVKDEKPAANAQ